MSREDDYRIAQDLLIQAEALLNTQQSLDLSKKISEFFNREKCDYDSVKENQYDRMNEFLNLLWNAFLGD